MYARTRTRPTQKRIEMEDRRPPGALAAERSDAQVRTGADVVETRGKDCARTEVRGADPGPAGWTQVTCKFVTKLPKVWKVPEQLLAVPAQITRHGLSEIINQMLGTGEFQSQNCE